MCVSMKINLRSRPWTQDGKTALDMATEYERQDIIDLIRKVCSVHVKF